MARPDLSMSTAQVQDLLVRCHTAVVAVPGPDGFPLATVALLRSGNAVVLTADDPVARALGEGAPVCVVADTWPDYAGIRGLIVRGSSRPGSGEVAVDRVASFDFSRAES